MNLHQQRLNLIATLESRSNEAVYDLIANSVLESGGSWLRAKECGFLNTLHLFGAYATGHSDEETIRNWIKVAIHPHSEDAEVA